MENQDQNRELTMRVNELVRENIEGRGVGILTTVSDHNGPHATWVATIGMPSPDRLVTMTSPDSRKVQNILENPRVEWLFTGNSMAELVYLRGAARIIMDPDRVEEAWNQMPDKSRAYFLPSETVGMTFVIIETHVDSVEYRLPREEQSYHLGVGELTSTWVER